MLAGGASGIALWRTGCCPSAMSSHPSDPAGVIERQVEAYNRKDIEALIALYTPDSELYEHPSTLLCKGTAQLKARYLDRFKEPNLHAVIKHRSVIGPLVIDHEVVTRSFAEGPGTIEVAIIYEVKAGRITRSWMLPGIKTLTPA